MTTPEPPASLTPVTRRRFLIGTAGLGLLAACSSDSDGEAVDTGAPDTTSTGEGSDDTSGADPTDSTAAGTGEFTLISFVPPGAVEAGAPARIAFGIANENGVPLSEDAPESLPLTVTTETGEAVGDGFDGQFRSEGLPRGYYSVTVEFPDAGNYIVTAQADEQELQAALQVVAAGASPVPGPGRAVPSLETPTTEAPAGVDPICTRTPEPCPFHDISLDAALAEGRPVVLFVATPEFCTTAICGPTLDVLIDAAPDLGDVAVIHAEVYTDGTATETTAAVQELGLTYEPALFLIDDTGTVQSRLDVIFDGDELRTAAQAIS